MERKCIGFTSQKDHSCVKLDDGLEGETRSNETKQKPSLGIQGEFIEDQTRPEAEEVVADRSDSARGDRIDQTLYGIT